MEWQPIETAPKDDALILIYVPEGKCSCKKPHRAIRRASELHNEYPSAFIKAITHWMPLPPPPAPTPATPQKEG